MAFNDNFALYSASAFSDWKEAFKDIVKGSVMKIRVASRNYGLSDVLLGAVFAFYPYAMFAYAVHPWFFFGGNAYIYFCESVILIAFIVALAATLKFECLRFVPFILLIIFFGFCHIDAYGYNNKSLVGIYQQGVELIIYLLFSLSCIHADNYRMFRNIIFFNSGLMGLIGILHFFFFPGLNLTPEATGYLSIVNQNEQIDLSDRESGILVNATAYADFVILGLLLLYYEKLSLLKNTWRKDISYLLLAAFFGTAVAISGSRYPVIAFVCVVVLMFFRKSKFSNMLGIAGVFVLCWVSFHVTQLSVVNRFGDNLGDRTEKLKLGLDWISSAQGFFYGVSSQVQSSMTMGGVQFSDNSFLQIALNIGAFMTIIMFTYFLYLIIKHFQIKRTWVLLIFFVFLFSETNAILWDFWMLYFFVLWRIVVIDASLIKQAIPSQQYTAASSAKIFGLRAQ